MVHLPQHVHLSALSGALSMQFKGRVTKQGELVVVSQKHRSQMMNLNEAVAKMEDMLSQASEVPKGPSQLTVARVRAL